jgi:glycosyltransferase involved in cell wall biosynthesis
MQAAPFISIIICTYNRGGYIRDNLHSLFQTNASPDRFEILIVDNNSTDNTHAVIKEAAAGHPAFNLKYIKETKQGTSHARNRGIQEASSPIFLFLDDDIIAPPQFIPAWIAFFKKHPEASGAGGKINVQFDDPRPPWMSYFLMPLLGYHNHGNSMKEYKAGNFPFGGNMAFRREVFERYGNFHTELGRIGAVKMTSFEKEFYHRLGGSETICYVPDAYLYHRVSKRRLTKDAIKKQALGLGKSTALQMERAPLSKKARQIGIETFKSLVTGILSIGYTLALQPSKAEMLIKFRWWIWRGYTTETQKHKE